MILCRLIFIIISWIVVLHAQDNQIDVRSLEKDFKSFEYKRVLEKGKFMLDDPFTNREDSLFIYQLMLSSAYALNDTATARLLVVEILDCEPRFAPNPRDTSPKIIEFFNIVRNQVAVSRLENNKNTPALTGKYNTTSAFRRRSSLLATVVLPGSGHLIMGNRRTGLINTSASALLAGLCIYSAIETSDLRRDYMDARGNADYNALYGKYNQYYKIRNGTMIIYALWSLYNLYELDKEYHTVLGYSSGSGHISLRLTYHF